MAFDIGALSSVDSGYNQAETRNIENQSGRETVQQQKMQTQAMQDDTLALAWLGEAFGMAPPDQPPPVAPGQQSQPAPPPQTQQPQTQLPPPPPPQAPPQGQLPGPPGVTPPQQGQPAPSDGNVGTSGGTPLAPAGTYFNPAKPVQGAQPQQGVQGQPSPRPPATAPQGAPSGQGQLSPQGQGGRQLSPQSEPGGPVMPGQMTLQDLIARIAKSNPQMAKSRPDLLMRAAEKGQKLLAPDEKMLLQGQKVEMDYAAKVAAITQRADAAAKKAQNALEIADIKVAQAQAQAQAATDRALTLQTMRDAQGDKNRDAKTNAATVGDERKRRAAAVAIIAKNGGKADPAATLDELESQAGDAVKAAAKDKTDAAAAKLDKTLSSREGIAAATREAKAADEAGKMPKPETIKTMGEFYADTGTMPSQGMGNPKVRAAIENAANDILTERGSTNPGKDLAMNSARYKAQGAAARSIAQQAGKLDIGTREIEQFAPYVLDASNRVDRSKYPTIAAIENAANKGLGGTDIIELRDWLQGLKSAYAQVLTRGGANSVDARKRADAFINDNYNKGQIATAIKVVRAEASKAESSAGGAREGALRAGVGDSAPSAAAAPAEKSTEENDPLGIR